MKTKAAKAFLAMYDALNEAHKQGGRDAFRREITCRCAEFNRIFPGNSEALVAMQMHFAARDRP